MNSLEDKFGMIQVYTGDGKGKTTAALGLAVRAAGHGCKILMIQFLKGDAGYGEVKAKLPGLTIKQTGRDCFVNFADPDPIDVKMAAEGWEYAKAAVLSKEYDLVILDEFNIVLGSKLLPVEEAARFLRENKRRGVEIILTGRMAPDEILDLADLVTDMREVRHYFSRGVHSRDGIDH